MRVQLAGAHEPCILHEERQICQKARALAGLFLAFNSAAPWRSARDSALGPRPLGAAVRAQSLRTATNAIRMPERPPLILTEENAKIVLNDCMNELEQVFGLSPESQKVGITGIAEFVELDGPTVVVRLKGRFWHQRSRVVERLENYVLKRIPECIEVVIEDAQQLDDADQSSTEQRLDEVFQSPADPAVQFGNEESFK